MISRPPRLVHRIPAIMKIGQVGDRTKCFLFSLERRGNAGALCS